MLSVLLSIAGIVTTLLFVVGTHEAAHFLMARAVGVKVLTFSIGFGKKLFSYQDKQGTEYALSLIPLGGYVRMLDSTEAAVHPSVLKNAYDQQSFLKKSLIILAGPFSNLLCAFLLYWVIFMVGFTAIKPIIGDVQANSLAARAGLAPSQQIIAIDETPTRTWTTVLFRLMAHLGDQDDITLTVQNIKTLKISTHHLPTSTWKVDALNPDPFTSLGLTPYFPKTGNYPSTLLQKIQFGPFSAMPEAMRELNDLIYFNLVFFKKMLTGKLSLQSLGGPITIFDSAGQALNVGLLPFLSFLAFISIAIGVINLIPIPGLDGGQWAILAIESLIRRPLPQKLNTLLYRGGLILIIFIFIQAMINDVLRLF